MSNERIIWVEIENYLDQWKNDQLKKLKSVHKDIDITVKLKGKKKNIIYRKEDEKRLEHPREKSHQTIDTSRLINKTSGAGKISSGHSTAHTTAEADTTKKSVTTKLDLKADVAPLESGFSIEGGWSHDKQKENNAKDSNAFKADMELPKHSQYRESTTTIRKEEESEFYNVKLDGHVKISFKDSVGEYNPKTNTFSEVGEKKKIHYISVVYIFKAIEAMKNVTPTWSYKTIPIPRHEIVEFASVKVRREWLETGATTQEFSSLDDKDDKHSKIDQTTYSAKKSNENEKSLSGGSTIEVNVNDNLGKNAKAEIGDDIAAHLIAEDGKLTPEERKIRHKEIMKALDQVREIKSVRNLRLEEGATYKRGDVIVGAVVHKQNISTTLKKFEKYSKLNPDIIETEKFLEDAKNEINDACPLVILEKYPELKKDRDDFLKELDEYKGKTLSSDEKKSLREKCIDGIVEALSGCVSKTVTSTNASKQDKKVITNSVSTPITTTQLSNVGIYAIAPLNREERQLKEKILKLLNEQYPKEDENDDSVREYRAYVLGKYSELDNKTPVSNRIKLKEDLKEIIYNLQASNYQDEELKQAYSAANT
jgi:hypothetical protein